MLTSVNAHDSEHKLISSRMGQKVVFVVYFIVRQEDLAENEVEHLISIVS